LPKVSSYLPLTLPLSRKGRGKKEKRTFNRDKLKKVPGIEGARRVSSAARKDYRSAFWPESACQPSSSLSGREESPREGGTMFKNNLPALPSIKVMLP
jgi:hypothetical protein